MKNGVNLEVFYNSSFYYLYYSYINKFNFSIKTSVNTDNKPITLTHVYLYYLTIKL